MNQADVEQFVASMDNVEREENFGYIFYFVGDDHRLPFVSLVDSDNEYDSVSHLNREGVFRINIGVSKATFDGLFAQSPSDNLDYTVLNVFLPHPEYAKQHFICILNPIDDNEIVTKNLMVEAHAIASARAQRRTS